jgi:hypothetical protein
MITNILNQAKIGFPTCGVKADKCLKKLDCFLNGRGVSHKSTLLKAMYFYTTARPWITTYVGAD